MMQETMSGISSAKERGGMSMTKKRNKKQNTVVPEKQKNMELLNVFMRESFQRFWRRIERRRKK